MTRHVNFLDGEARVSIQMKVTDGDGHTHLLETRSGEAVLIQPGDTVEFGAIPLSDTKFVIDDDDVVSLSHGDDTLFLRGLYDVLDSEQDVMLAFSDAAVGGRVSTLGDLLACTDMPLAPGADMAAGENPGDVIWLLPTDIEAAEAGLGVADALQVDDVLNFATIEGQTGDTGSVYGGDGLSGYLAVLGPPTGDADMNATPAAAADGHPLAVVSVEVSTFAVSTGLDLVEDDSLANVADSFILL